jgi:hypothetical protein
MSGVHFEWQSDEVDLPPLQPRPPHHSRACLLIVILAAVLLALPLYLWYRRHSNAIEARTRQDVQIVLDMEQRALAAGDGELFLALQTPDAAWLSARLRPESIAAVRAGRVVSRVEAHPNEVWANVTWQVDGTQWQRVIFFRNQDGRLVQIATPQAADYWGGLHLRRAAWGNLLYHAVDEPWAGALVAEIDRIVATLCPCPQQALPLTVHVTADFGESAERRELRLPSARLLALDETGQPAPLFWQQLEARLKDRLAPAPIRFAVPDNFASHYRLLAGEFSLEQPGAQVEIVRLSELPADAFAWLQVVDGAAFGAAFEPAFTSLEALLAAGLVYDLTDFAFSDPDFGIADFHPTLWEGAWWQGRLWFTPEAAALKLLFVDVESFRLANRTLPASPEGWHWQQFGQVIENVVREQPEERLAWAFVDGGLDTMYAYAYSHSQNRGCPGLAPIECRQPPLPGDVAAALAWYAQYAGRPGQMPDLTQMTPAERAFTVLNLTSPRRAAVWVEEPHQYELYVLHRPLRVLNFPHTDGTAGVTPLWPHGSLISRHSGRPFATWQWLKFLSRQQVAPHLRLVPARYSVAASGNYWHSLPEPLRSVMPLAFSNGRLVAIEEQSLFSWEQLAAVAAGELTPEEAARSRTRIRWFGQ